MAAVWLPTVGTSIGEGVEIERPADLVEQLAEADVVPLVGHIDWCNTRSATAGSFSSRCGVRGHHRAQTTTEH